MSMKKLVSFTIRSMLLLMMVTTGHGPAVAFPESEPVFSDEFNGPKGASFDPEKWTAEIGGKGWGNRELQYYTSSRENVFQDGKGFLIIRSLKTEETADYECWYGRCGFTSARLITKNKFDKKYGKFEARIKIPGGVGIWPAFWMLGNDIDKTGWPKSGEIDILENIGREPLTIHGTIHGPGYSGAGGIGAGFEFPDKRVIADDFHVYSINWKKNKIEWFIDGIRYQTITPKKLPKGKEWVFNRPFFLIMNLAIGGTWGGDPNAETKFPAEMIIDYVRVYER